MSAFFRLCNSGHFIQEQNLASTLWTLLLSQCFQILAREWQRSGSKALAGLPTSNIFHSSWSGSSFNSLRLCTTSAVVFSLSGGKCCSLVTEMCLYVLPLCHMFNKTTKQKFEKNSIYFVVSQYM